MSDIKTYSEMNSKIVDLLRGSGEAKQLYAAARIEELEARVDYLVARSELLGHVLGLVCAEIAECECPADKEVAEWGCCAGCTLRDEITADPKVVAPCWKRLGLERLNVEAAVWRRQGRQMTVATHTACCNTR